MATKRTKLAIEIAAKKAPAKRTAKRVATGLDLNHTMIYTSDYARALEFYRDLLGFRLIEEYPGGYGRLQSPKGNATIALHVLDPGRTMDPAVEGFRLYLEVKQLDAFCNRLVAKGVVFERPPTDMPWGWRHAYLRDPDGHELSLYWAGQKRFSRTIIPR